MSGKGGGDGGRYGWMEVKGRWYDGIWASEIIFRFSRKKKMKREKAILVQVGFDLNNNIIY